MAPSTEQPCFERAKYLEDMLNYIMGSNAVEDWVGSNRGGKLIDDQQVVHVSTELLELFGVIKGREMTRAEEYHGWVRRARRAKMAHDRLVKELKLKAHPWIEVISVLIEIEPDMTQTSCDGCGDGRQCILAPADEMTRKGKKCKCETCRVRKVMCNWGTNIPQYLYEVKLTMLQNSTENVGTETVAGPSNQTQRGATTGGRLSSDALDQLARATELAIAEADLELDEMQEMFIEAVCSALSKIRMQ